MSKILKIERAIPKETKLPEGSYIGYWSGYKIALRHNSVEYTLTTEEGIKGVNIKVVVTVKDGKATCQTLNN